MWLVGCGGGVGTSQRGAKTVGRIVMAPTPFRLRQTQPAACHSTCPDNWFAQLTASCQDLRHTNRQRLPTIRRPVPTLPLVSSHLLVPIDSHSQHDSLG